MNLLIQSRYQFLEQCRFRLGVIFVGGGIGYATTYFIATPTISSSFIGKEFREIPSRFPLEKYNISSGAAIELPVGTDPSSNFYLKMFLRFQSALWIDSLYFFQLPGFDQVRTVIKLNFSNHFSRLGGIGFGRKTRRRNFQ